MGKWQLHTDQGAHLVDSDQCLESLMRRSGVVGWSVWLWVSPRPLSFTGMLVKGGMEPDVRYTITYYEGQ